MRRQMKLLEGFALVAALSLQAKLAGSIRAFDAPPQPYTLKCEEDCVAQYGACRINAGVHLMYGPNDPAIEFCKSHCDPIAPESSLCQLKPGKTDELIVPPTPGPEMRTCAQDCQVTYGSICGINLQTHPMVGRSDRAIITFCTGHCEPVDPATSGECVFKPGKSPEAIKTTTSKPYSLDCDSDCQVTYGGICGINRQTHPMYGPTDPAITFCKSRCDPLDVEASGRCVPKSDWTTDIAAS